MTLIEVFVNQKRINVCEHTVKMAPHDSFEEEPPGEGTGRRKEWWEGEKIEKKGLCLEDRMNYSQIQDGSR